MRIVSALLALLVLNLFAAASFAAEAPVFVSHDMVAYNGGEKPTVDVVLHVANRDQPVSNLTLKVVPPLGSIAADSTVKVGNLAAGQRVDLPLRLPAPPGVSGGTISKGALSVGGRCLDAGGNTVEFATTSTRGGAL